jgi:hypothetical protein
MLVSSRRSRPGKPVRRIPGPGLYREPMAAPRGLTTQPGLRGRAGTRLRTGRRAGTGAAGAAGQWWR